MRLSNMAEPEKKCQNNSWNSFLAQVNKYYMFHVSLSRNTKQTFAFINHKNKALDAKFINDKDMIRFLLVFFFFFNKCW